jgi:L-rhamnose isomerase/sugar isomerase
VVNLQEAYAKAALVDRDALAAAQVEGDVLRGHEILLDAYKTDVRPQCAAMRESLGAAADPVAELRPYVERIVAERGSTVSVAGGWGR